MARRGVILPDAEGSLADFWQGIREGRLLLQECRRCGHVWHPPADVCRTCQSFEIGWRPVAGTGTLYSYTVVHHPVHPVVEAWVPYTLCMIALDEGPRILATTDPDRGEALVIGTRMELGFRDEPTGFRLPVFRTVQD
jgi:uncharacterized OB-fold protein